MNAPPARRWISVSETAEMTGLSVSGIRKAVDRGEIPAVRIGRSVRVDRIRLEAALEAQLKAPR